MPDEWTEKYRPKSLSGIVGNEAAADSLKRWAEGWASGRPRRKAVVLRGDPGTGKTSAALALAHDMGWDFIEMNASDHRNAASIRKVAGIGAMSQTFSPEGEFLSSSDGKRKLVIIDEADSLFGREDFGGAKAIVETVKGSGQPIVLIVNDYRELTRKSPGIRYLADNIQFVRLTRREIVRVLKGICDNEEVKVSAETFERIADNASGDMRAAINDLQMLVEGRDRLESLDYEVMGKRNQLKELQVALRDMFGASGARKARDATMDLDMTPDDLEKWIEESIPQEMRSAEDLAAAFEALSKSDIYLGRTRRLQYYALWGYAKELMTGGVALARKHGPRPYVPEYRFPGQFIVLSRAKGPRAARHAIASKLAPYMHTSRRVFVSTVLPLLVVLVRNDRELLVRLIKEVDLDEGDVAFMLDLKPDQDAVEKLVFEAKGAADDSGTSKSKASKGVRRSAHPF